MRGKMERKIYITDGVLSLAEYVDALDDRALYDCWLDEATQRGYNFKRDETFEEFSSSESRCRFEATILRCSDGAAIGHISVSPENSPPDLAIMLYRPYRGQGYGTRAFSIAVRYCFETLQLDEIYAGCYASNEASRKMLAACGFQPHPEGNVAEKHYLTGEDIVQYDYVKYRDRL